MPRSCTVRVARETGRKKIRIIFKFSRWLKRYAVRADALTLDIIDKYVHRKGKYRPSSEESITLKQFAEFLVCQGVIANSLKTSIPRTAIDEVTDNFAVYLYEPRSFRWRLFLAERRR